MTRILRYLLVATAFWGALAAPPALRAQQPGKGLPTDTLAESARRTTRDAICSCIDSIASGQSKDAVNDEVNRCIKQQVFTYQLMQGLLQADQASKTGRSKKKSYTINLSTNETGQDFKSTYNELEAIALRECPALKRLLMANDESGTDGMSSKHDANDWYNKGVKAGEESNYTKAVACYRKAVEIDPRFAFAWDNLGRSYRRLDLYDSALYAYDRSLAIDPRGVNPLQNAAVASALKKDYTGAIKYYKRLQEVQFDNPEVAYGLGQIYALYLNDYEAALHHMCAAYRLYAAQKSAYRADAEQIIQYIHGKMKEEGHEKEFRAILEEEHFTMAK